MNQSTGPARRLFERAREALHRQHGMTLAELMIAMGILSVVLLVFTSTLASVQNIVLKENTRSRLNNEARLVLQSIDRNVRSGNLLYDPASEVGNDPYDVAAWTRALESLLRSPGRRRRLGAAARRRARSLTTDAHLDAFDGLLGHVRSTGGA